MISRTKSPAQQPCRVVGAPELWMGGSWPLRRQQDWKSAGSREGLLGTAGRALSQRPKEHQGPAAYTDTPQLWGPESTGRVLW